MNDNSFRTVEQIRAFLKGSEIIKFDRKNAEDSYKWVQEIVIKFKYNSLNKNERGIIRKYLQKITGYSRAQVTRLITQYMTKGKIRRTAYSRPQFQKKYTNDDIKLLAETDHLHELSGPGIKKILEYEVSHGNSEYSDISNISVSHVYNLRKTSVYRSKNTYYSKTRAVVRDIAQRKKPVPNGKPGYIRVDTVHQGDLNGDKGVYHINAVDEVTQWEIIISVEKISESYLIPSLTEILEQFPFIILGFHSDNGSEYINKVVAKLLNKLLIQFTKSRPRHSNDNALAESKNASVVRKCMGYAHIPQKYAAQLNQFHRRYLNVYVNFHRPCFFPKIKIDKNGKTKKSYPYELMMTPFQKLCSIAHFVDFLKATVDIKALQEIENQHSPNQFRKLMLAVQDKLWHTIFVQAA